MDAVPGSIRAPCNPTGELATTSGCWARSMDRIELHLKVPRVDYDKPTAAKRAETLAEARERVTAAWSR